MQIAQNFIVYNYPNADIGSFEPLKGEFKKDESIWIIICSFNKRGLGKKARIVIDDKSYEVASYEVIEK